MPTMRDIKGRIRSVTTTKKTTKAMNLVSSSKLQRAKGKLNRGNPFLDGMVKTVSDIIKNNDNIKHPYFADGRQVKKSLIIVIANDRGLCGGYNINVCKYAQNLANSITEGEVCFYTIGNKAKDYFRRLNSEVIYSMSGISESPLYEDGVKIAADILKMYEDGIIDKVYLVYTQFVSAINYIPKHRTIFPLHRQDYLVEEGKNTLAIMRFEPSPMVVLNNLLPKFLATRIYFALANSAASGQGATMTAMDSATENAENIIDDLTLLYNRARQGAITQEISEIVAGANAI